MNKINNRTTGTKLLALLLVVVMMASLLPMTVFAASTGTKPEDGKTTSQPFASGTGGSNSFRIPAIVTLDNGTIVAAADARWNQGSDGGGNDTIVSYSKDNGATWNYTFANYLGDNGNQYSTDSTCFIDPALATDGKTVYMLVDLHSCGVATMNGFTKPSTAVAFTDDGYLKLAKGDSTDYSYYLKDSKIYDSSNNEVSGYTVDEYFNITGTDGTSSNIFFSGSPYRVVRTTYMYLTKSVDGGATWSAPMLIPNIKADGENACLVGPGRGTVTSDGTIIFPFYRTTPNGNSYYLEAAFVYSKDNGETWQRSDSNIKGTSEASIVELNDGTLRVFFRYTPVGNVLKYMDVTKDSNGNYVWGDIQSTSIPFYSDCQLSAIKYSKVTKDGKEVILLSCPGNTSERRQDGRIYAFTADDMQLIGTLNVNSGSFSYSCITELSDGSIGLLWEPSSGVQYNAYAINYILGNTVLVDPTLDNDAPKKEHTVNGVTVVFPEAVSGMTVTEATVGTITSSYVAYSVTPGEGYAEGTKATITLPLSDELKNAENLTGFHLEKDGAITHIAGNKSADGKYYSFDTSFSTVGVMAIEGSGADSSETVDVNIVVGGTTGAYSVSGNFEAITCAPDGIAIGNIDTIETKYEYELASIGEGTFFVSTKDNDTAPSVQVTLEDAGNGTYYIKNSSGNYIYPDASRRNNRWSYSLGTGQNAVTVAEDGNGYRFSRSCSSSTGYYTTTAYLTLSGSSFGSSGTATTLYLYKQNVLNTETKFTFSGIGEGKTTATVGGVTYNIAVTAPTETLTKTVYTGGSLELPTGAKNIKVSGDALTVSGNNIIAGDTAGTATVTFDTLNAYNKATAHYEYTVNVLTDPGFVTDVDASPIMTSEVRYTNNTGAANSGYGDGSTYTPRRMTKLSISAGQSYDIDVDTSILPGDVIWATGDSSIATIDPATGELTAVASGETWVSVTGEDGPSYKIPVVVYDHGTIGANDTKKFFDFYISDIDHTTTYWGLLRGETSTSVKAYDLVEVQNGEVIYFAFKKTDAVALNFFAAPDEGYALMEMKVLASNGDYSAINSDDPVETDFIKGIIFKDGATKTNQNAAGYKEYNNTGDDAYLDTSKPDGQQQVVLEQVQEAIDKGCDGGHGFTQYAGQSNTIVPATISNTTKKLPTVSKVIDNVNGYAYYDGMVGRVGDTVTFKITIYEYGGLTGIDYSDIQLLDTMFVGSKNISNVQFLDATGKVVDVSNLSIVANEAATEIVYYVQYTIGDDDLDKLIHNSVTLNYSYKTHYSAGNFGASASAEAKLNVTNFIPPKDIVIDFGLPVIIETPAWNVPPTDGIVHLTLSAKYGTVEYIDEMNNNETGLKIKYTPNGILSDYDVVTLTNESAGMTFSFKVIPATTVYYEDSFVSTANGTGNAANAIWNTDGVASTANQALNELGSKANYGFDAAYKSGVTYSMGSANKVTVTSDMANSWTDGSAWPTASFTFTGTGFDLISLTNSDSGLITYEVTNNISGKLVFSKFVTNYYGYSYKNGEWVVEEDASDCLYQIPVVKVSDLPYGTYTVKITVAYGSFFDKNSDGNYSFWLDGVRVYNTLKDSSIYAPDNEAYPQFIELRNQIANITDENYNGVFFIDGTDEANLEQYKNYGPNHEVYLANGQSIAFRLSGDLADIASVQIGAKAVNGNTKYKVNNGTENELATATDMYYDITAAAKGGELVVITNTGENILSLTTLKLTFNDAGKSVSVGISSTEAQQTLMAVRAMFAMPVEPAEPFEPEYLSAKFSPALVVQGKTATLTVTASEDVEAICVDGEIIETFKTRTVTTGWGANRTTVTYHVFTYNITANETADYSISAFNADGVESEAITATLTVWMGLGNWFKDIIGRFF